MKRNEIEVGGTYSAKVSGKLAPVRIVSDCGVWWPPSYRGYPEKQKHRGWEGFNLTTKRQIHIRSAARLRKRVDADRLTMIRDARSAGASYEDARSQVERNEQRLRDIAADIRAKTETSTS
jgi:hypothetical protein